MRRRTATTKRALTAAARVRRPNGRRPTLWSRIPGQKAEPAGDGS
jgi:hypothetical protein